MAKNKRKTKETEHFMDGFGVSFEDALKALANPVIQHTPDLHSIKWKDAKIDDDVLVLLCDNEQEVKALLNSIKSVRIFCNQDAKPPILTLFITYTDNRVGTYQYNQLALLWKQCDKITRLAVDVWGSTSSNYRTFLVNQ